MFAGQSHENGQVMRVETINAQGSTIPTQVAPSTFFFKHGWVTCQRMIQPDFSLHLSPLPLRLTQPFPAPIIKP